MNSREGRKWEVPSEELFEGPEKTGAQKNEKEEEKS